MPFAFSLPTTSGTSATRCSPAAVSVGTPIRIGSENVSDRPDGGRSGSASGGPGVRTSQGHDGEPDPHLHQARRRRRDAPRGHEPRLQAAPPRGGVRDGGRAERDARRGAGAAGTAGPDRGVAATRAERSARPRRRPVGPGRGEAEAKAKDGSRREDEIGDGDGDEDGDEDGDGDGKQAADRHSARGCV